MEHNIDALATLDGIHAIPHDSHHGTVESWPPSTKNAKRRSVQDWITTAKLLVFASRSDENSYM
jgi:hypothetical protein